MRTTICKKCGAKIDATLGICPFCGTTFAVAPEDSASRERDKELEWAMSMDDEPLPGGFVQGNKPRPQADPYQNQQNAPHADNTRAGFGSDGVYHGASAPQAGAYGAWTADGQQQDHGRSANGGQPSNAAYGQNPNAYGQGTGTGKSAFGIGDIENADNDELFNTRVWKNDQNTGAEQPRTAAPPVSRQEIHRLPREQEQEYRRPQRQAMSSAEARAKAEEERRKQEELHKKKTVVTAIAIAAALTLLLCIFGGVFNFNKNTGSQTMPDVVGDNIDTAKNILTNDPYKLNVETETVDSSEGKDKVVEQSIEKGKKIKAGETVTLKISNGQGTDSAETSDASDYVEVPDLTGKTYDQAKSALEAIGLQIGRNDDIYSDQDAGDIVAQTPNKGAKLQKGDLVTVTVSKGEMKTYTITVNAGKGGTVSPGTVTVQNGDSKSFTFTPSSGYEVQTVLIDGVASEDLEGHTFTQITGDHTIKVIFTKKVTEPSAAPAPETPAPAESPAASNATD